MKHIKEFESFVNEAEDDMVTLMLLFPTSTKRQPMTF